MKISLMNIKNFVTYTKKNDDDGDDDDDDDDDKKISKSKRSLSLHWKI